MIVQKSSDKIREIIWYDYIYHIFNVVSLQKTETKKLSKNGLLIQTYHYSFDQVYNNDIKLDNKNCLNCPYSYNQNEGNTGGCYTHKGTLGLGLRGKLSMLHRLFNKNPDLRKFSFNSNQFQDFIKVAENNASDISLIRFGTYGEPIYLGENIINTFVSFCRKHNIKRTGYSRQWSNSEFNHFGLFLNASTFSVEEAKEARGMGFIPFTSLKANKIPDGFFNCPASKEAGKKLSCSSCGLCSGSLGTFKNKTYLGIGILKH